MRPAPQDHTPAQPKGGHKLLRLLAAIPLLLLALAVQWIQYQNNHTAYTLPGAPDAALAGQRAEVHFIDVGQGDCVLLCQGGEYALIDTGTNEAADAVVAYLQRLGVEKLRYLVLTHLHTDHAGGARKVLQNFAVDTVLLPDLTLGPAPTAASTLKLLETLDERSEKGELIARTPSLGETLPLGLASLQVVGTGIPSPKDLNNTSIITLFRFDNFAFFDGGDAEKDAEAALLQDAATYGWELHADLYKASHHGSSSSNTDALLRALSPLVGVASCGLDNDYGHPHREVRAAFAAAGIPLLRTDLNGSVVVTVQDGVMVVQTERRGDV